MTSSYSAGARAGCARYTTSVVTFTLTPNTTHALAASIADANDDVGSGVAQYTYTTSDPVVTLVSPKLYRDPALCALACGELVQTYTTPAYVSLDAPRSLTLVYRSGRAKPLPLIELDVSGAPASTAKLGFQLRDANNAAVTLTSGGTEVVRAYAAGTNRLAAQFDPQQFTNAQAPGPADYARVYTAVVTAYRADGTVAGATSVPGVRVPVDWLNGPVSPHGAGWGVAGLQQFRWVDPAYSPTGGLVLMDGDGAIGYWTAAGTVGGVTSYTSPPGDFTTVQWNANTGALTRRYPDGTLATFNGSGNELTLADRFGNATQFAYAYYAEGSRLTAVTDPAGHQVSIGYRAPGDASGWRLRSLEYVADNAGRSVYFGVDGANDLRLVNEPVGTSDATRANTRYWAYGAHALVQTQDARGGAWDYAYDPAGQLASATTPSVMAGGTSRRLITQLRSWAAAVVPSAGTGTSANPAPALRADTVRAMVADAQTGLQTRYALDGWGAPTRVEAPGGVVSTAVRDDSARVTQVVGPTGVTVNTTWQGPDAVGVTRQAIAGAPARVVNATYEPTYHQVTSVTGSAAAPSYAYYTGPRLDSVATGTGATRSVTKYTTDGRGRVTAVSDAGGHPARTFYAASGLQNTDSSMTAGNRTTRYARDAFGRVVAVTDPRGKVSRSGYDVLNRALADTAADGGVTRYGYDALYLTSVTDPKGNLTQYARNALGAVEAETRAGSATPIRTAYDAAGRVASVTNRRGGVVSFGYDALGQLASRTADGVTVTYGADPLGRWTAAGTDTVYFDALGRVTVEAQWRGGVRTAVTSHYDALERRDSVANLSRGSAVRYYYGAAGQLDSLRDLAGRVTRLGYDAERMANSTQLPNGIALSAPTSPTHNRASQTYSSSALNNAAGADYAFGPAGELVDRLGYNTFRPYRFGTEYRYDDVGRLGAAVDYSYADPSCVVIVNPDGTPEHSCRGAAKSYGASQAFTYDQAGNRTDANAVVDPGNRLQSQGGVSFTYDADGNVTRRSAPGCGGTCVTTYTWDALGQLTGVAPPTGGTLSYRYDGWGRRAWQQNPDGSVRQYTYDGDNLWAELNASGAPFIEYTFYPGVDQPHSMRQNNQVYHFHQDASGNVVGLTRADGSLDQSMTYAPYGTPTTANFGAAQVPNRLRFKAREHEDASGLDYMRARWYDPALGRFLSEDPIGLEGGTNLYTFGGGDPINNADPSGTESCADLYLIEYSYDAGTRDNFLIDRVSFIGRDCGGQGGGKGGSGQPKPTKPKLSPSCVAAIKVAGQDQASVARANANWSTLTRAGAAHDVSAELLAAIAIRETGFLNVRQRNGGLGRGVFQIDLGAHPSVTSKQAFNVRWSANFAAAMLQSNSKFIARKFPAFTPDQLLQATAASYNLGPNSFSGDAAKIDLGSTGGNYGSNVVQLMGCFGSP